MARSYAFEFLLEKFGSGPDLQTDESISMIKFCFVIYLGHRNIAFFSRSAVFEVLGKGFDTFF
jgi:hypothetical protein